MTKRFYILVLGEIICASIVTLMNALVFYIVKRIVDNEMNMSLLMIISFVFIITYIIFSMFHSYFHTKRIDEYYQSGKEQTYDKIMNINSPNFFKLPVTDYISIIQNDISTIKEEYVDMIIFLTSLVIKFTIYLIVVFWIDYRLILFLAILFVFWYKFSHVGKVDLSSAAMKRKQSMEIYEHIVKNIFECKAVINDNNLNNIEDFYMNYLNELSDSQVNYGKQKSVLLFMNNCKINICNIVTVLFIMLLCYKHIITLGTGALLYKYSDEILYVVLDMISCVEIIKGTAQIRDNLKLLSNRNGKTLNHTITNIELRNVTVDFLNNSYNVDFEQGRSYLIKGNNGAGKSTLLNIIKNTLMFNGSYYLDNECVNSSFNLDDEVALMPQFIPNFHVTFDEFVTNYFGLSLDEIQLFIDSQQLNDFKEIMKSKDCSLLSSGQLQKLCIVLLRLSNYSVKLYDEPTANIDAEHKGKYLKLITSDKESVIIVIGHDIENQDDFDEIVYI